MRDDFGALLQAHIDRSGLSRNAFSHRAAVDNAYVVKLCHGQKTGPTRSVVSALESALGLRGLERDRFYAAAGYLAPSAEQLGGWDDVLTEVAGVLGNPNISDGARAEFRLVVRTLAARYQDVPSQLQVPARTCETVPAAPGAGGHIATLMQVTPTRCAHCGGSRLCEANGETGCGDCGR